MEKITLKNSNMHAIYDTMRYGFISIKSPIDDCLADFVITPEEFPQYDVEDAKWLGTINGLVSYMRITVPLRSFSKHKMSLIWQLKIKSVQ